MATKECPNCEQEIGESETTCPRCQVNISDLEDEISVVDRAQKVIERRKAKEAAPVPTPTAKKRTIFRSLAKE